MPNRVAGISASTTIIMVRLRSEASRTCGAPVVTSAGVKAEGVARFEQGLQALKLPAGLEQDFLHFPSDFQQELLHVRFLPSLQVVRGPSG
jgi:hypothetical protein